MSLEHLYYEAFNLICGEMIGSGMTRKVFNCRIDNSLVVKSESGVRDFQNIMEWQIWQRVRGTDWEKWFAPCEDISPDGYILLQKRTSPIPADQYPDKVPRFFTDMKRQNFGWYKGHLVAHDYGVNLLMEEGMTKRMRKAHWYDAIY